MVRWRCADRVKRIKVAFDIDLQEGALGRLLKTPLHLGLYVRSHLSGASNRRRCRDAHVGVEAMNRHLVEISATVSPGAPVRDPDVRANADETDCLEAFAAEGKPADPECMKMFSTSRFSQDIL